MATIFGFYVHHRSNGVPFYVGKGTEARARLMSRKNNRFHQNVVAKEGKENITVTFTPCLSEGEAFEKEVALIAVYRAIGVELVNATDGGEGPSNPRPEVRAKISNSMKRAWQNPETRQALVAAIQSPERRAISSANGKRLKGKKLSPERCEAIRTYLNMPEVKERMRSSQRGKQRSIETRAKMSRSKKALYADTKTREQMSQSRIGKKHSSETKAKMSAIQKALRSTPEYKALHPTSAETRSKIAGRSKALWATPEYREKVLKAVTGKKRTKETCNKISEKLKAHLAHPEAIKKRSDAANTPEALANYRNKSKAMWADPVFREKILAARKKKRLSD